MFSSLKQINFKLPIFQNLWTEILNSQNSFSKELVVNINNTSIKLSYGVGGLHSVNSNEEYVSDSGARLDDLFCDSDVLRNQRDSIQQHPG